MPPSRIGKFSQRLRSLMRGGSDATVSYETEIATMGLLERVLDECEVRDNISIEERFGLVALLQTLALDRSATSPTNATTMREQVDVRTGRGQDGRALRNFDAEFLTRKRYDLVDLTGSSHEAFLERAYRCVLKREPDRTGSRQFLAGMNAGKLDRIDVLHALNASFEGRSKGVVIAGLKLKWLWRRAERVPVAGAALAWLRTILTVRTTARRLRALEERVEAQYEQHVNLDAMRSQTDAAVAALTDRIRRIRAESRLQMTAAAAEARDAAARLQRLEDLLDSERARVDALCAAIERDRAATGSNHDR